MVIKENVAREVVKFLRSQTQQVGNVCLLGIKVSLPNTADSDEVSAYITQNYMQYNAHSKSEHEAILSIWHKHLEPCTDSNINIEKLAENLVELLLAQKRTYGELKLLSLKAILPKDSDSDMISKYIIEKHPEFKAHSKNQGPYPIVAIGYK